MLGQNGTAIADATANGTPIAEQAPAKQTYKQKREERKRDEKARRFNTKADHVSYNMVEQMQNRRKAAEEYIGNRARKDQIEKSGLDKEMLKTWYQEGDTGFIDKYIDAAVSEKNAEQETDESKKAELRTKAEQERKEALDIIVSDLLKAQITPDMFKPAYLEKHMGEMQALADRMRNFEKLRNDPKNRFYFNSKNTITNWGVALLNGKLEQLTDSFCAQLDYAAGQKAVDAANGGYLKENEKPAETQDHLKELTERLGDCNTVMQMNGMAIVDREMEVRLSEILKEGMDTNKYQEVDERMGVQMTEREELLALVEAYGAVQSEHSKTWIADYAKAKHKEYEELLRQRESEEQEQARLSAENAGNAE